MIPDPAVYLEDMLGSIAMIERHLRGMDRAGFMADPTVQEAVLRRLEIIGEAASRASCASATRRYRGGALRG